VSPRNGITQTPEQLLDRADQALFAAKRLGTGPNSSTAKDRRVNKCRLSLRESGVLSQSERRQWNKIDLPIENRRRVHGKVAW
jgi:predicted signal transduction protein with EAL and GGDEF domain